MVENKTNIDAASVGTIEASDSTHMDARADRPSYRGGTIGKSSLGLIIQS
jgi:hypothetical protein